MLVFAGSFLYGFGLVLVYSGRPLLASVSAVGLLLMAAGAFGVGKRVDGNGKPGS